MREYLVFRCYGPMTSWGDIAVGEHRRSFAHPSKSAILGLVAAALGIRRNEERRLRSLHASFGFALCMESEGLLLRDYHTIQTPSASTGAHRTRRDELSVDPAKLNTLLSTREYRCDSVALVALWESNEPAHSLEEIGSALRHPCFTLYFGRKSCPPALPLHPLMIPARDGVQDAFFLYLEKESVLPDILTRTERTLRICSDTDADPVRDKEQHRAIRRDVPANRARWQFADRWESLTVLPRPEEDA